MQVRVTQQTLLNLVMNSTEQETNALGNLQQQATTGQRLNTPSDGPLDMVSVLGYNAQNLNLTTDLTNIDSATSTLNDSVSTLQAAANVLSQANQVAIQGVNGGNTQSTLNTLAQQVDNQLQQLLGIANTQNNGQYLYSGTDSQVAPFTVTATNGQGLPTAITYQGGADTASIPVGQGQTVNTLYSGAEVFQQQQRGTTAYSGPTGATAGNGTDSATGRGTLVVTHTTTTYAAGSGVQAGTGSAAGDNIIGAAGTHTLTIDDTSGTGASGTVSLDGGPAVAFTSNDANLQVTGPNGEVVYVNTTAITPGFNGTVAITANGTLSVDGGATSVPIDFSTNQVVTDSQTGAVTNVNGSTIEQTGTDQLDYTGTSDAFQSLMNLRDDLLNTRGLSAAAQAQAISNDMTDLQRNQNQILNVAGEQSTSLQSLSALQQRSQAVQLQTQEQISNLQSADITQVAVQLQEQQNLLQMTLASAANLFNVSLLDYIK